MVLGEGADDAQQNHLTMRTGEDEVNVSHVQLWQYSLQRWQITRLAVQLSQPAHTQFSADAQRASKQAVVAEQPFKTFVSIRMS